MDSVEAIKRIENHMRVHKIGEYPHIHLKEALDMAIAALQEMKSEGQDGNDACIKYSEAPIRQCDGAMFCPICGSRLKL